MSDALCVIRVIFRRISGRFAASSHRSVVKKLDGAKVVYWLIDDDFEWLHASLFLTAEAIDLTNNGKFVHRKGIYNGRIEGVVLMVMLKKIDGPQFVVSIDAKAATSFSCEHFDSKTIRLDELCVSAEKNRMVGNNHADHVARHVEAHARKSLKVRNPTAGC